MTNSFKFIAGFFLALLVAGGLVVTMSVQAQEKIPPPNYCVSEEDCEKASTTKEPLKWKAVPECKDSENKGICVPAGSITLNVPVLNTEQVSNYEDYIQILFRFLLGGAGVVAVSMLVVGGYLYITSAGNQSRISRGKEFIVDALIGLVLVFGSVVLLQFINTRLVDSPDVAFTRVAPKGYSGIVFCSVQSPPGTKCGQTTTQDGVPCISRGDSLEVVAGGQGSDCVGGHCLPTKFGGYNNLVAYKCYQNNLPDLILACNSAPIDACELVNEKIEANEERPEDVCGKTRSECAYAEQKLKCYLGTVQTDCNFCKYGGNYPIIGKALQPITGWFQDDTYLYCQDGVAVPWSTDDTWLPGSRDEAGAICCYSSSANLYFRESNYFYLTAKWYGEYFNCYFNEAEYNTFKPNQPMPLGTCHAKKEERTNDR